MKEIPRSLFIIVLIVAAAFFANNYFVTTPQGFTVNSITTSPNYITSSTELNSVDFLIDTSFDDGGQSIVGYLSPNEIKQKSGYETEFPLTITASAVNEVVDYSIINNKDIDKLYEYSITVLDTGWINNPNCPTFDNKNLKFTLTSFKALYGKKYCVYEEDVGNTGLITKTSVTFNSDITVNARGETYTKTIGNYGLSSNSVQFRDNNDKLLVTAKWTGSLITGNEPPESHLYVTTYRTDMGSAQKRWRVTDISKFKSYDSALTTNRINLKTIDYDFNDCRIGNHVSCQSEIEKYIDDINAKLNVLSTGTEAGLGGSKYVENKYSLDDAKLRVTLDRRFSNPKILFTVNAAWVGIKFGVGQPEIISANCPDFSSGDNIGAGVCNVKIKNIGTAVGTFETMFIPSSGSSFRQQSIIKDITLQPNEIADVKVYLSHGTSIEESSYGTIRVEDIKDDRKFDTMMVSINMGKPKQCTPYAEKPIGQSIYRCNAEGTGYTDLIETCLTGTIPKLNIETNHFECKELTESEGGGNGGDIDWNNLFNIKEIFGDGIVGKILTLLLGENFGVEDIIPLVLSIAGVILGVYIMILLIPIVIPWIGKMFIGLIMRK